MALQLFCEVFLTGCLKQHIASMSSNHLAFSRSSADLVSPLDGAQCPLKADG